MQRAVENVANALLPLNLFDLGLHKKKQPRWAAFFA